MLLTTAVRYFANHHRASCIADGIAEAELWTDRVAIADALETGDIHVDAIDELIDEGVEDRVVEALEEIVDALDDGVDILAIAWDE